MKLFSFSYKKTIFYTTGLFFVVVYCAFKFSFEDSFDLYYSLESQKKRLDWLKEKEGSYKKSSTKFKLKQSRTKIEFLSREILTTFVSEFAIKNDCFVAEIPKEIKFKKDNLEVSTNNFTLRGSFKNLVKFLNRLELMNAGNSNISSGFFFVKNNPVSRNKELFLTVVIQTFNEDNHE